uniref:PNPLA domain-containing protein n=1 Tax=Salix viminalis TaxID=40686 RepID=A0A6N2KFR7_SALVM
MKRWDDCAKMRVLMRQCGVSKTPGCSWIDIGACVHEFHAGDSLHHHSVIIYQLLNEEMKREVHLEGLYLLVDDSSLNGMKVAYYFDFIAGTSTGGLMTSMLAAPNDENDLCLLKKILLSFIKAIVQAPTGNMIKLKDISLRALGGKEEGVITGPGATTKDISPEMVVTQLQVFSAFEFD